MQSRANTHGVNTFSVFSTVSRQLEQNSHTFVVRCWFIVRHRCLSVICNQMRGPWWFDPGFAECSINIGDGNSWMANSASRTDQMVRLTFTVDVNSVLNSGFLHTTVCRQSSTGELEPRTGSFCSFFFFWWGKYPGVSTVCL